MAHIRCTNCNEPNPITSEYQTFCRACNAKLDFNYQSWLLNNPGKSFDDFVRHCEYQEPGGLSADEAYRGQAAAPAPPVYRRHEPKAIAGFVLGIVSYLFLGFITGVLAIIFSALGLQNIKRNPEMYSGKGMAIAGLVLGIVNVAVVIIVIIVFASILQGLSLFFFL